MYYIYVKKRMIIINQTISDLKNKAHEVHNSKTIIGYLSLDNICEGMGYDNKKNY